MLEIEFLIDIPSPQPVPQYFIYATYSLLGSMLTKCENLIEGPFYMISYFYLAFKILVFDSLTLIHESVDLFGLILRGVFQASSLRK